MESKCDISVVMSVYDGVEHLRESVESVLSQEGVDLEFIIVDDGSTDESGKILDEYVNRDNRVRVIHQENTGLTKALIRGCAEARGKYIARQDAGDISIADRLRFQKAALDADDTLCFVSCWTEYVGPEYEFLYLAKGTGSAIKPSHIISEKAECGVSDGPSHHGSVMFCREIYLKVGGYRSQFYFAQDCDLWYRFAETGKFQMVSQTLYSARLSPNSISGENKVRQEKLGQFSLEALYCRRRGSSENEILSKASMILPTTDYKDKFFHHAAWLYFIGNCLRGNSDPRSVSYFKKAIIEKPYYLKAWIRLVQTMIGLML